MVPPAQPWPGSCSRARPPPSLLTPPAPGSASHTGTAGCFHQEVVVVVHEVVGVTEPAKAVHHLGEHVQESLPILVVQKSILAGVTSGGDVVHCPGVLDLEWSCYINSLSLTLFDCKTLPPLYFGRTPSFRPKRPHWPTGSCDR